MVRFICYMKQGPRRAQMNSTKTTIESWQFIGKFFLVVKSNLDNVYFNEKQTDDVGSKYTVNIEPLLDIFTNIGNSFGCTDLENKPMGSNRCSKCFRC